MIMVGMATLTILTTARRRKSRKNSRLIIITIIIAQGMTVPAMHALWGVWAPAKERSRLANFTYTGQKLFGMD